MLKNSTYNSASLLGEFRGGKQKAFTEIFHAYYSPLSYYSFKITNDLESSQDIVSESLMKIWEKRAMFFAINVLKTYLYTTVRNASYDWVKKTAKSRTVYHDNEGHLQHSESQAFQHIVEADVFDRLTTALDKLSPQCKRIIQMTYFEGKKAREVAEELGVCVSTIKTQKERAMAKLKKSFMHFNLFVVSAVLLLVIGL